METVPSSSDLCTAQYRRAQWIDGCTGRLLELRPADGKHRLATLAAEMWDDVGSFDPCIAAEMEHESRL